MDRSERLSLTERDTLKAPGTAVSSQKSLPQNPETRLLTIQANSPFFSKLAVNEKYPFVYFKVISTPPTVSEASAHMA